MSRIIMYLRLSKEDDLIKNESNSISSQREIIRNYIRQDKKLRKMEVVELKDDGFSGKNMNRPGMKQLLEMVRLRQVDCIIVKDLSRFSRDYLMVGKYTEQIFPFMGIRFISINDSYDSEQCAGGIGEIDVAFKSLLYDFFSEDLSQKIKSSFAVRKSQGKFMNAYAPYGYRKCKDDHNKLEIEPVGAEVVRRIFKDYADGKSMYAIAQKLNQEGVIPPTDYIRKRDGKNYFRKDLAGNGWSTSAVSRILHNEIFGGIHIYHKYHNRSFGANQSGVPYPEEEWKRIADAHIALIDKDTYHAVHERLKSNRKAAQCHEPHVLQGKIFCGNCGYAMGHTYAGRHSFGCNRRFMNVDSADCVRSINDSILESILLSLIQEKIRNRIDMEEVLAKTRQEVQEKKSAAEKRLKEMHQSYDKIDTDLFQAYEAFREGKTEKSTYLEQKEMYEKMLTQLKENMKKQHSCIEAMQKNSDVPEGWNPDSPFLQIHKLDRAIVELMIQKVYVYKDNRIHVIWNFKNEQEV